MLLAPSLLSCVVPPGTPTTPTTSTTTSSPPSGDTGSTGLSGTDTGCVPGEEIPLDGIDQACNGWSDEVGVGEAAAPLASVTYVGVPFEQVCSSLDAGLDADGQGWLLIGAWGGYRADRAPVDGVIDLTYLHPEAYRHLDNPLGTSVVVTDWAAGPLIVGGSLGLHAFPVDGGAPVVGEDAFADLAAGDVDGDGADELVTGVSGTLRVVDASLSERLTVTSTYPPTHNFANYVGEVGDLTGDGLPEITAYGQESTIGGRAWIVPGELTGTVLVTDVAWSVAGVEPEANAGYTTAVGDVDGDGYADLLASAPFLGDRRGAVYLQRGPIAADASFASAVATFDALIDREHYGIGAVDTLADLDGDGGEEVAIASAYLSEAPGRIELYASADASGVRDAYDARRVLVGLAPADGFGAAFSADTDLDGDGVPDLAACGDAGGGYGYVYDEGPAGWSGGVYVFTGPLL